MVIYGQSNAEGNAGLSGDTSGFPAALDRSLMYDFSDGTIKPIIQAMITANGFTSTGHAWSEFANEWYRISGRGAVVVNCAAGGKQISQLAKGGSYYTALINAVSSAKDRMGAQSLTLGKIYIVYHQGETDQLVETTFSTYVTALSALIANLSTDIGIARFANCTVGCPTNRPDYSWSTIQNAQKFVCNGRELGVTVFDGCPSFSTRDSNTGSEGVHYTQRGYNTMGRGAAQGLWSVECGGIKTKTDADFLEYTANKIAPWSRAKHCAAVARYSSTSSSWVLLNRDNSDGVHRPANISSVRVSSDNTSLLFVIADNAANWFGYDASLGSNPALGTFRATVERMSDGSDYTLQVKVWMDIDIIVNVKTGALSAGRPASAIPSWLASIITSAVGSSGTSVLYHPATQSPSIVSHYGSSPFIDTGVTASVFCPNASTTRVSLANITNSPLALVSLRNMLLPPSLLRFASMSVRVKGMYGPDF
nr:sialate O-acetylesterase [Enterobacter kobei]